MKSIEINGIFEVRDAFGVVVTRFATSAEADAYIANPPAPVAQSRRLPTTVNAVTKAA